MVGYQDILSKYIDVANAPIDKASEVLAASNEKKQAMGYRDAAQTDVNLGRPQTAEELISEVTDVNGIIARAAGASRFGDDSSARRSNSEMVSDSIKGVGLGLGGSLLNIANMGVGVVSDDAGADMANWISQKISDRQSEQSDGLNARRRAYASRSEITQEENARKYELERETDGNMVAGFKRIGRDFLDAASKTIDDPTLLADTAANGVGSLLAGGGIGKGLQALKFGAAAMPAAIGLLEGGGAYQQTTKEALDRGASNEEANNAGLTAAVIQAPIGAATGLLTSKFEANPLSVTKVRNALSNVLKEGVEESIQSGSGQGAQNFALSQEVTPDQDLLAGVGEQAGIGAVGGLGTAGVLQAPGVATQTVVNTAKGIGNLGSAAFNAIGERGDTLMAEGANASPSSSVNIQTNIATTMAVAPEIQEQVAAIVTPEKAPVVSAALDNLFQKAAFDPAEADTQPPVVAEAIRESTDRFDAMSRAAAIASDTKLDPADRIAAGQYINDTMSNPDLEVLDIDLDELLTSEADNPAVAQVQKFKDAIENIQNNPEIIQARTAAQQLAADITPEQVSDVSTPQGQVLTHAVASLAQEAPESTNPEVLKAVLLHADNGSVEFTPEETEALQAAQAIHTIAAETQASAEREGFTVKDVMTTPIQDIASDVSNDIRANTTKDAYAPSASTYLKEIARAVKTGNPEVAREKLQEIMLFAKHMQGKVNALNENLKQGNWSKDNKTAYDVLTVATRKFIPAGGSLNIIPGSVGSVKFARRVNLDAQSVVSMANALATTYPKLGIKPVEFTPLNETIREGDLNEVLRSYRKGGAYAAQPTGQPIQNTQAPVETTEVLTVSEYVDRYIAGKGRDDPNMEQFAANNAPEIEKEFARRLKTAEKPIEKAPNDGGPYKEITKQDALDFDLPYRNDPVTDAEFLKETSTRISLKEFGENLNSKKQVPYLIDLSGKLWNINENDWDHTGFLVDASEATMNFDTFAGSIRITTYRDQVGIDSIKDIDPNEKQLVAIQGLISTAKRNGAAVAMTEKLEKLLEAVTPTKVETPEAVTTVQTEGGDQVATTGVVEPQKEPTPQTGGSTDETVEKSDTVAPDKEATSEAKTTETVARSDDPIKTAYPDLVEKSYFSKAFKLPNTEEPKSRLVAEPEPVGAVYEALGSTSKLMQYAGKDTFTKALTPEITAAYQTLISEYAPDIAKAMKASLDKKLPEIQKLIADGRNITAMRDLRAFNITDENGDYNQTLSESAILAGFQWLIAMNQKNRQLDSEEAAKILGVDEYVADNFVDQMNAGVSQIDAARTLGETIRKFWGVDENKSMAEGHVKGIPEGVAKELLLAMESVGLIVRDKTMLVPQADGRMQPYTRILLPENDTIREMIQVAQAFPDAINQAVLNDEPPINYIGTPPIKVAEFQMRNRLVKNTDQQKLEIEREQNIPYTVNYRMFNFAQSLGKPLFLELFGHGDLTEKPLNKEHLKSLEGQNLTIGMAYDYMMGLVSNIRNQGADDTPVFFEHNSSRVGRTQQIGKATPQGSKITREMLLSTWATIDLNKPKTYDLFMLAMGQHWGLKVETMKRSDVVQEAEKFATKLPRSLKLMQDWLSKDGTDTPMSIAPEDVAIFKEEFGDKLSPGAFHAAMEYARYQMSSKAERAEFKTATYVEADGKTDGPINALMHLATGEFTPHWIKMMAKGGLFLGSSITTLAQHFANDKKDLYKIGSDETQGFVERARQQFAGDEGLTNQMNSLLYLFDKKLNGFKIQKNEQGGWDAIIDRGVTKNPMTVTIYGAGSRGIAGKIAKEIADAVYEQLSTEPLDVKTKKAFENLLGSVVVRNFSEFQLKNVANVNMDRADDQVNFKFTTAELDVLTDNINHLFVKPLRDGIDAVIGEVNKAKDGIRKATQVQSIFLEYAFKAEMTKAIEEKKSNDPEYNPSDGLSQKEIEGIRNKLKYLAPYVETGTQSFYMSASERADLAPIKADGTIGSKPEFSRALSGEMASPAYTEAPTNVGVAGIPTMVIAPGDGQMMQNFMTADDAPTNGTRVFDGANMSLDNIEGDSVKVNRAVYEAWLNGNPIDAVAKSFDVFMQKVSFDDLSEAQRIDLTESLFGKPSKGKTVPKSVNDIKAAMTVVNKSMFGWSIENQARKNVLKRINMHVDHMASAESPYAVTDKIELSSDPEVAAVQMNKLLDEEKAKLIDEANNVTENIAPELSKFGLTDETGAKVLNPSELRQLLRSLKVPAAQWSLFQDIGLSLQNSDYSLVFGSKDQLSDYAVSKSHATLTPTQNKLGVNGYISMADQTIYLVNPSSETLLHELVHATTFNKVASFYSNPESLTSIERDAASRIEGLMNEWLNVDESPAADTVKYHIARGEQAVALNEFMAWNLSNQDLITKGKEQTVLSRIAEAALKLIKEFIWGKAKAPQVGSDLYSNLRFNTSILMHNAPTMQERLNNTVLFQSNNQRLNELDQKFAAKLALLIQKDPVAGQLKVNRNIPKVSDVTDSFNAHGFNMTMQEKGVFSTILNVMMTEAYLNPNALTRIQEIYDHAIKNLTVESFMPAVSRDPSVDRYYAQEKFNTIIGNYITEYDEQGRSTLLPSFVALAAVNDNFRKVLSEIGLPKSIKSTEKTLDAWLENKAIEALDYTSTALSGEGRGRENAKQALDALTANLADTLEDRELYVEQFVTPVGNAIDKGNGILRDGMARLAQKGIDIIDKRDAVATNKVEKATLGLARIFVSMANEDRADEVSKGTIAMVNRWNMPAFVKEVMIELVGRNSDNASVTDMAKHVRAEVQKLRQQFREDVPKIIQGKFSRKLTDQEWSDLTKGLGRTDIGALKNGMTVAQIVALLNNDTKLEAKILDMEEDLSSIQPDNWPTIQKKAKQLAQFMLSGDWSVFEGNALKNAYAIAMMMGEQSKGVINANDATVQAIDQLVSLYAVQALDADTKSTLSSLAQDEAEGMEFATNYLIGRRISELQKVENSGLARANHYKGHVPTENQSGTSLVVASNSEYGRLRTLGFKPVGVYTGSRSEQNPGLSYFFAPLSGRAMFSQGIIQNVRNTASGVDPRTGFSMGVMTAGRITDPRLVKQIKQRIGSNKNTTEPLAPIYDEAGSLVAYERTLDPNQVARLEQNNNLSTILGQWIGRQVEEAKASAINESLIDELGKMWTDPARDKIDYVNLFDQKKLTPIQKDAVKLLTPETRQYAESVFGKDEFWVRKDLINQVTGYRSASVGDVWTGTTNISEPIRKEAARIITGIFGIDAYRKLVTAEKLYQNFIADARATIVVKSVIVPVANGISGIYQLVGRGVPIVDIAKGYPRKLMEANAYIKNRHREIVLMAELEAVGDNFNKERKIKAEIQAIQDGYKRLSIYPILHELSSITDAGISHETTLMVEGKLSAAVERWVDKLPKDIKTAGRYGIISKDTALFKGLQRAVQYGDFLAKAVLYDDLVKRQGKTKEYALGRIMDEFVNYDLLAGRSRSYMESMGLMWFWHFKLRSVKIALSTLRNNPLHMLLAGLAPQPEMFGSIGMPLTDNAVAVLGDGRFEYSVGPGMGLNAHQMNPYWNAMF